MSKQPDEELGISDPGDDTLLRYRYQTTYAAILAVNIVDDTPTIQEVFCEHHEDILLKLHSGKYHAIQVKTQQPGGNPFKASDDSMRTAIAKFVHLEQRYGDLIDRYSIATNHQFFDAENSNSLYFLISLAKEAT